MKKMNKEYFWLGYLVFISAMGILLLTGHMPFTTVLGQYADNTQEKTGIEQLPETEDEQEDDKISDNQKDDKTEVDPLKEEYQTLLEEIEKKEALVAECQEQLAAEEEKKFTILQKYKAQMEGIRQEYSSLINYAVKNFEANYDTDGSDDIQDINQFNYALGELSKYTPWGITVNLFTSMAIENSNSDYEAMVNANEAFGTGMQKIIVDTGAKIDEFSAKLDFYEMLTTDNVNPDYGSYTDEKIREIWENQYLMEYALKGNDVDIEPYALEVRKQLYILGAAINTLKDFYSTLLTDGNSKTNSINNLENQYQEIMALVDPDGNGKVAALVESKELDKYISPLIYAGMDAYNGYAKLGGASPLIDIRFTYTHQGRIYCYYKILDKAFGLMFVSGSDVYVYYADEKPVYVNGYCFYNGKLLNGNGSEDAETLYEEALWFRIGNRGDKKDYDLHREKLLNACGG